MDNKEFISRETISEIKDQLSNEMKEYEEFALKGHVVETAIAFVMGLSPSLLSCHSWVGSSVKNGD